MPRMNRTERNVRELEEEIARLRNANAIVARLVATDKIRESAVDVTHFPNYPGIYFLMKDDEIVYVGQSTRLCARLAGHVGQPGMKEFNRISWVEVPIEDLNFMEAAYILFYRPKHNLTGA